MWKDYSNFFPKSHFPSTQSKHPKNCDMTCLKSLFCLVIIFALVLKLYSQIQQKFDFYDVNKDGTIDFDEFVTTLKASKEDVQNLIDIFDMNGDNMIDREEFNEIPRMYGR